MITANELRIGNWISDIEGIILKVDAIKKHSVNCLYEGLSNTGIENVRLSCFPIADGLFGIGLAPYILEKAGFLPYEDDAEGIYEGYKLNDFIIERYVYTNEFEFRVVRMDGFQSDILIKYLHQLQNLYFSITGQELEINLS